MRKLLLVGACIAAMSSSARAGTILQYQGDSFYTSSGNQIIGEIRVGASNVEISGWGVYGKASAAQNLKWVLFDEANLNSPLFLSAAQAIPQTTTGQWYDYHLATDINLIAGHEYAIGVITSGSFSTGYTWFYSGIAPSQTEGGLTRLGSEAVDSTGAVGGVFTNTPFLYNIPRDTRAAVSMRVFTPDPAPVPEPMTVSLLGAGLIGFGLVRHRRAQVQ